MNINMNGAWFLLNLMLVVVAMRAGPPERAALHGRGGPDGHHELEGPGGGVGLVREIPVEEAGDREHPEEIKSDRGPDGDGTDADPDHGETGQMEDDKGDGTGPIHLLGGILESFDTFRDVVRIEPADQGTEESVLGTLGKGVGHLVRS